MHKQRIFIFIASLLGILATWMPWITKPGYFSGEPNTYYGYEYEGFGLLTLFLFGWPFVLSLLNDRSKIIAGNAVVGSVLPSILASICGFYVLFNFTSKIPSYRGDKITDPVILEDYKEAYKIACSHYSTHLGLYLVAFMGIAIVLIHYLVKDSENTASQTIQ